MTTALQKSADLSDYAKEFKSLDLHAVIKDLAEQPWRTVPQLGVMNLIWVAGLVGCYRFLFGNAQRPFGVVKWPAGAAISSGSNRSSPMA
jgi:hypothetical protein